MYHCRSHDLCVITCNTLMILYCKTTLRSISGTWTTKGHFSHKNEGPWPLHFKHSHWWEGWSRTKFASHYVWETNSCIYLWMQDDRCQVYMDSYMALNGSCFMVTWTILKNHLLEVGLTGRPWHSECSQPWIYSILSCVRIHMNRNSLK